MFPLLSLAEDKKDGALNVKEGVSWSGVLMQSGLFLATQQKVEFLWKLF